MIVEDIMDELHVSNPDLSEFRRVGKKPKFGPRLLKVRVNNVQKKSEILSKSRLLRNSKRFKKVYVRPDRTPMQQEHDKQLNAELYARRQDGEDVILFKGRVIARSDMQNFHQSVL